VSGKDSKIRVPLLKVFHILIQSANSNLAILCQDAGIILISDLDNDFVEWLFLLARADFSVIVGNAAVASFLLSIVALYRIVK
jgi:hypothetical protein